MEVSTSNKGGSMNQVAGTAIVVSVDTVLPLNFHAYVPRVTLRLGEKLYEWVSDLIDERHRYLRPGLAVTLNAYARENGRLYRVRIEEQ